MARPFSISAPAQRVRGSVFSRLLARVPAGEVFRLHVGDTHLLPHAEASRVLANLEDAALYRYAPTAGSATLLEALAQKLACKNGMKWATPAHVAISIGATHALYSALRAILDPGDEVLLPSPYWPLVAGMIPLAGAHAREVPFYQRLYADPQLDPRALLEPHLSTRTVALYVITPNNPDGKVLTRAQGERIAGFVRDHNLWLVADEVYEDYLYEDDPAPSLATLPGMGERTITVYSFSKSHAMAGLRIGYATGPVDVIAATRRVACHTVYSVPSHLQDAAEAALAHEHAFMAEALETYSAARNEAIATVDARFYAPDGASYLFLDLREMVADGRDATPVLERLAESGVLLAPGDAFGADYEGYARLCFTAVPRAELRRAIDRMNRVFAELRRSPCP
jgi:aspartate/methionine/tyrosine aminotransferase